MSVITAEYVHTKPCRLIFKEISAKVSLQKMVQYFSSLDNPAILGGSEFKSERNRYSYFAAEPVEIFEISAADREPFEKLRIVLNKYRLEEDVRFLDCRVPKGTRNDIKTAISSLRPVPMTRDDEAIYSGLFTGGWIGFFSYCLNRFIENIPDAGSDELKLPLIRLCFYDKVICFDHIKDCFHLFAVELPDDEKSSEEKIAHLEAILNKAENIQEEPVLRLCDNFDIGQFKSSMTKGYYLDAIAQIKRYIYDGDVYQINFSQRFCSDFSNEPYKLFLWQNRFNPSPYSAYIDAGDYKIVSASPELFVNINNGTITTCPIKGTRPRTNDKVADEKNRSELIANEKEKAELDMIIDLERNDFGRICRPGSIKVAKRRDIEEFSTVFHAVATIQGRLREDIGFVDCLKAVFPGGSISGAPKISAMKIINELEPTSRGLYTGSIGWIDLRGNASLNIAIRTIIIKDQLAYAQTGGGIVADSVAQSEWDETLIKVKALLEGINSVNKPQRKE